VLWLVGAGPGDPGLLTVRARCLLREATVVLADPACVALAREVGAGPAVAAVPPVQDWPRAENRTVVRLVPGDGLAGSATERAELQRLGIDFEVVPGIAAAAAEHAAPTSGPSGPGRRPLAGRTVVVARPEGQQAALAEALRRRGARVLAMPVIAIGRPDDGGVALADAVRRVHTYDWLVVTSANGARALLDAIADLRDLVGVRLAAIGPATAAVLAEARVPAAIVPARFVAEGLLDEFPAPPAGGGRVLLVRAAVARDTLPDGLRRTGWTVDVVAAYRTVAAEVPDDALAAAAAADVALVTSPSTIERLAHLLGADRLAPGGAGPAVIAIGPVTAAAAQALGVRVDAVAERYDVDGLIEAVCRWATAPGSRAGAPVAGGGPEVRSGP